MTTLRHTDPTIYAVAAALYEDTSLTYADIGQRLGLTENEMVHIYQSLRNAGALTFQRRVSSAKPQGVGRAMARLIGQSKEQAEFLRHIRKYGWTFEYTGGGHVRCIGPQGQHEIVSSRPGPGAREQFRKHGVAWPGDRATQQEPDAAALINDEPEPPSSTRFTVLPDPALPETADGTTPIEPIAMPAADLTLELVARSVDNLAEMFEVLAQEVGDLRTWAEREFQDIRDRRLAVDDIEERVYAVEQTIQALTTRIANVDPIGSLRAALRRNQPST